MRPISNSFRLSLFRCGFDRDGFEFPGQFSERVFDRQSFQARSADKADTVGMLIDVSSVVRGANRTAMRKEEDVKTYKIRTRRL